MHRTWKQCVMSGGVMAAMILMSQSATARPTYPPRLPSTAPGACVTCHVSAGGGGARTSFGEAFRNNGLMWDATLAGLDSDGDGYSNGVELGDTTGTVTGNMANLFVSAPGDSADTPCGNDALDATLNGTEACDGVALDGQTCQTQGFLGGTLSCSSACTFDVSQCSNCGDDMLDAGEQCDGTALDAQTCQTQGFASGTLSCSGSCDFDVSQCSNCGNDTVDAGEQCDGVALDAQTCQTRGFASGTLACDATCMFDTTQCVPAMNAVCGDDVRQGNEACDGADLDAQTCETRGFVDGTLVCDSNCMFDDTLCNACGNGVVEVDEVCDPAVPVTTTCESLGYGGGTLACSDACLFDESQCDPCGNAMLDGGEVCDGAALGGATCQSEGFDSGTLGCAATCDSLDTSACMMAPMDMGMDDMGADDMGADMDGMNDMDAPDMMAMNDMDGLDMPVAMDMAGRDEDMMAATPDMPAEVDFGPMPRMVDEGEIAGSRGCCAVVEPTTDTSQGWLLLMLGFLVMGWRQRRRD